MDLKVAKRFMDELLVSFIKKGGSDLFIIAGAALPCVYTARLRP